MVGYIAEPLAKILFPLMKCWEILEIKIEISGVIRAAPEGIWVLGGGIEIPATFYVHVRKVIKNADAEQG